MSLLVKEVIKKTPAKKSGIKKGDIVHFIDKIDMHDFIDDIYVSSLINPSITVERNGKQFSKQLIKAHDEEIGLVYEEELYPAEDECNNRCIFCFVDQLPKDMRKSLYVRDDDWRYSVLYGNYITMTNMSNKDFQRIASRRVSPLYISVHASDFDVRNELLKNKRAKEIISQLQFFYNNEISFHSQIVLCPDINDGEILDKTIEDLAKLYPYSKTLSIVPVGLTKYRENLPSLTPVNEDIAKTIIDKVNKFRQKFAEELGTPFVYAADEFYSKARLDFPRYDKGEINAQKANGVGLFSDFISEFETAIIELKDITIKKRSIILATGVSAYTEIKKLCEILADTVTNLDIEVIKTNNLHFGDSITVAGLLTGQDIINAVGKKNVDAVFIPESSLRNDKKIFLDDLTLKDVKKAIGSCVIISPNDGYEFAMSLVGGY